jgi:hypothetical protein
MLTEARKEIKDDRDKKGLARFPPLFEFRVLKDIRSRLSDILNTVCGEGDLIWVINRVGAITAVVYAQGG